MTHRASTRWSIAVACVAFVGILVGSHTALADERCTTKPAVCHLLRMKKEQSQQTKPSATASKRGAARCRTKPAVCARMGERATTPGATPRPHPADARCSTKPAVCARLRK